MALTRAQLLMGNKGQGTVLPGQVQGVKQGAGVEIEDDGTIRFDASTAIGVVRTNNAGAFNGYFWPTAGGTEATFLSTDISGNLTWQAPNIGSVVSVGLQPTPARVGRLWFDSATRTLKVFENVSTLSGQWTPVSQGRPVAPGDVSASPAFVAGDGTLSTPYSVTPVNTFPGAYTQAPNVITVSGLAPYQYVPIEDELRESNGYRFHVSNSFADENGVLTFLISFTDFPATSSGQAYGARFRIGFESCYIDSSVTIADPLSLTSPGTISGTAQVGQTLTYTTGTASGGIAPYTYTWVWKKQSDDSTIQTGGSLLTVPPSLAGDRVYVSLTISDSTLSSVSGSTSFYPLSPLLIQKAPFPNTNILYPTTSPGEVATVWADSGTTLSSSGCIEFKVGAGSYSQGPTVITNGGTITTRWITSPSCAGAVTGTTISGCIFDSSYEDCDSFTIDRIPSPFSFLPVSSIIPGNVGTSQIITPMGINSTAYVTYSGTSTATSVEASVNGGAFAALPTYGTNTFPINPGETLQVRATTGSSPSSSYTATINIGESLSVQSSTFTLNTSAASNFTTPIPFPVTTIDVPTAVAWLAGDGATTLTSTDCIEFSVNAGAFSQGPTPITTGDTITTRWNSSGSCGGAAHGTVITGTVTNVPAGGTKTSYSSLTIDRVPASFSFTNLTNQTTNTLVTSNTLNIVGFNAPAYITRSAPPTGSSLTTVEASVAGGPWTVVPTSGTTISIDPVASGPGDTLQIRGITGASAATNYGIQINVGESTSIQTSVWTATTSAIVPGIVTPSILTPVNGSTGLTPYSSSPAGITVTSSAYSAINGAGAHASTDWEVRSGSTGGPVVVSVNSLTQLTSYFLNAGLFSTNTYYYVRCRYYSADVVPVVSSWSAWSSFRTASSFNLSWVVRVPADNINRHRAATWIQSSTNKFVIVGNANNPCRYSSDGITWGTGSVPSATKDLYALAPGFGSYADTLVAVGQDGTIRQSTNGGVSWTTPSGSLGSTQNFQSVVCNPSGRFVAGGNGGVLRTTTDLTTTWTTVASGTSSAIYSLIWDSANSRFLGTATDLSETSSPFLSNRLLTSPDGLTWAASELYSQVSFPVGQILIIPGSPNRYIIVSRINNSVNFSLLQNYAVSTDLVTWSVLPVSPSIDYIQAGVVGAGFTVLGGQSEILSSFNSSNPLDFTQTSGMTTAGVTVAPLAYSPTLNRYVSASSAGQILSTS